MPIGPHFFVYAKGKAEGLVRLEEKMAKSIALSVMFKICFVVAVNVDHIMLRFELCLSQPIGIKLNLYQ